MVRRSLRAIRWRNREKYLSDQPRPRPACRLAGDTFQSRLSLRERTSFRGAKCDFQSPLAERKATSGGRLISIARADPRLVKCRVLHALAAGHEIAVDGGDRVRGDGRQGRGG